jgi:hypothetical protein
MRSLIEMTYRGARRVVVGIAGATVLLIGVAMIVLPGPAIVVIPLGLGILGLEFAWARHWLHAVRERSRAAYDTLAGGLGSRDGPVPARERTLRC